MSFVENVYSVIKDNNLFKKNEVVGVATSGGADSMALLHVLNLLAKKLEISLVAVHINHSIRENSNLDAKLVMEYCKKNNIKMHCFKIDAVKFSKENKLGLEEGARTLRYGIFDALIQKNIVDKFALAHHKDDQAETILMNMFRGCSVSGFGGMSYVKGVYIRPFLNITKTQILQFNKQEKIDFVTDETNVDNSYNRNFVRNVLLPQITSRWPSAVDFICNLAKDCVADDNFIQKQINIDGVLFDDELAKIPVSYFLQHDSVVYRIIMLTLKKIGITKDIERKHLEMVKKLALDAQNGKKINLPLNLTVVKEYDYITFKNTESQNKQIKMPFKVGKYEVENFGEFEVRIVEKESFLKQNNMLYFDFDKVPQKSFWRFRQDGDIFEKFGGKTKKLKSFLIDKKIPKRKRETVPCLANKNEILLVLGEEISEKIKVDEKTKNIAVAFLVK